MVISLDTLILSELSADFLLLLAVDRLCAKNAPLPRLLAGAAIGAGYSAALVLGCSAAACWVFKLASALLMLLAAFGAGRGFFRAAAVFAASGAAFAGVTVAVSLACGKFGAKQMLLSFALSYALLGVALRYSAARGGPEKAVLRLGSRSVSLMALRDTGNSLRDAVTGAPVLIADEALLVKLLPPETRSILAETSGVSPPERLEALGKAGCTPLFRLLPYSSVGVSSGMLLCFRPDELRLGKRRVSPAIAALAPNKLSAKGEYSAIINGEA